MSYKPNPPDNRAGPSWTFNELQRIGDEMERPTLLQFEVLHIEPTRPVRGMVAYADGTDWNPGAGEGLYVYKSSWVLLG